MKLLFCVAFLIFTTFPFSLSAEFNPVERVSIDDSGNDADDASNIPGLAASDDGRYVAFQSAATNLVSGDQNELLDIFVYDRTTDTIERVSVDSSENESDGESRNPSISSDGRYVLFESDATNLVAADGNEVTDVFLRDRTLGTTTRVSINTDESEGNGASLNPALSPNGMYVVFQSDADNLVDSDSNSATDIFLRDLAGETTTRVSVADDESESDGASRFPSVSNDGDLVVFESEASLLVNSDGNGQSDVFLRAITAGTTTLLSADSDDVEGDAGSFRPKISADGEYVAFYSDAENLLNEDNNGLRDVFLRELDSGDLTLVSAPAFGNDSDGNSFSPQINSDGQFIIFESLATNLVVGDDNGLLDIFGYDRVNETTTRISVDDDGDELVGLSRNGSINSNGQFVAYVSEDSNIVSGDNNLVADVFVVDTQCLLEPTGVTPADQDSDGTNDCDDACPTDEDKIALGACGCGVADTDTDSDGEADCNDACPSDADKTEEGICGCGVADEDTNGNSVLDCLDPTSDTRPRKPVALHKRRRNVLRVILPGDYAGQRYLVIVKQGGRTIKRFRTRKYRNRISAAGLGGTITVRYRILLSSGKTKLSGTKKVTIR